MDVNSIGTTVIQSITSLTTKINSLSSAMSPIGTHTLAILFFVGVVIGGLKLMMGVDSFQESIAKGVQYTITYFIVLACISGASFTSNTNLPTLIGQSFDYVATKAGISSMTSTGSGGTSTTTGSTGGGGTCSSTANPICPLSSMASAALDILKINVTDWGASSQTDSSQSDSSSGFWSSLFHPVKAVAGQVAQIATTMAGGLVLIGYTLIISLFLLFAGLLFSCTIILSNISFAFACALAPICIPWIMWDRMSFLYDGWFKFTLSAAMTKLVVAFFATAVGGLINSTVTAINAQIAQNGKMGPIEAFVTFLPVLLCAFLIVYMALEIPKIAQGITGGAALGINHHSLKIAANPAGAMMAGARLAGSGAALGASIGAAGIAMGAGVAAGGAGLAGAKMGGAGFSGSRAGSMLSRGGSMGRSMGRASARGAFNTFKNPTGMNQNRSRSSRGS